MYWEEYINAAKMVFFSNSSVGQDGPAIAISRGGTLRVLFEASMELRLISKSSVISGSALIIIFYSSLSLVWFSVVCVQEGKQWADPGPGMAQVTCRTQIMRTLKGFQGHYILNCVSETGSVF